MPAVATLPTSILNQLVTAPSPPPVLFYEMGGVGTALIKGALQGSSSVSLHYANVLNHLHARELNAARRAAHWQAGMLRPQKVHEQCAQLRAIHGLKIITIVDDPIAANLNGFFLNLGLIYDRSDLLRCMTTDELCEAFLEKCQHLYPQTWFNKEMQQVFGIDLYASPFPVREKATRVRQGAYDLLVLRNDLNLEEKTQILMDFLDLPVLDLNPTPHARESKGLGARREFLGSVSVPKEYISKMLGSRYMRHFYSKIELEELSQKWAAPLRTIIP